MNRIIILLVLALSTAIWRGGPDDDGSAEDEVRRPIHLRQRAEEVLGLAQAYQVGKTVYVSSLSGKGASASAQLKNAYKNLLSILQEVGAEREHIVKETVFTTNMNELLGANDIRKVFYGEHLPACSFIGVDRLLLGASQVEIELVIQLP